MRQERREGGRRRLRRRETSEEAGDQIEGERRVEASGAVADSADVPYLTESLKWLWSVEIITIVVLLRHVSICL